jgi:inner membrane protein involved in colicin E2 resistance
MNGATSMRLLSVSALFGWALVVALAVALAVFFGLLASTANPILVGVGTALLAGALLFENRYGPSG